MAIAHCTDTQGVKKRPKVSEMHNLKLFNFLASQKKIYSYLFQITMMLSPGQKKHN